MRTRRFDTTSQTAPQPPFAQHTPVAETAPYEPAHHDPLPDVDLVTGALPPQAQAAALSRSSDGRWDRVGHVLLQLQRRRGNRYVQQVLGHPPQQANRATAPVIQTKLMLGPAGDRYEREADRVAREVVRWRAQGRTADGSGAVRGSLHSAVHHSPSSAGGAVRAEIQQSIRHARGRGQPLPHDVRKPMEQAFGADFSSVRIHTDQQSAQLGQSLQAHAFTVGRDIFLRPQNQNLGSRAGQELLAHELAHVVQQSGGAPAGHSGTPEVSAAPTVIQRVGGEKIGFDFAPAGTNKEMEDGQKLLREVWAAARQAWHNEKIGGVQGNVEAAAQEMLREKERRNYKSDQSADPTKYPEHVDTKYPVIPKVKTVQGFSKYYAGQLTQGAKKPDAMLAAAIKANNAKGGGQLQLDGTTIRYQSRADAAWVDIATLKRGKEAFEKKADVGTGGAAREIYSKKGVETGFNTADPKEYVKDSRGVETRRYAYVEKNYYQMMEFFMTRNMEGRFQSYMRAAGESDPDIYEHRDEGVDLVRPEGSAAGKLTVEQMAVAHQKLGSGPQQRGVSLTATPKVNATYVNTGENFRTDQGFRLKVDLSKIPERAENLLINHYSQGGVVDAPGYDTRRERGKPSKYPYKESSIHARELFLSQLKPEWVVAIESHDSGNKTGSGPGSTTIDSATDLEGKKNMFSLAKGKFKGDKYRAGFKFGLTEDDFSKASSADAANSNFKKGFEGSRLFVDGWTEGKSEYDRVGSTDEAERVKTPGLTMSQYIYDKTMERRDPRNKYDLYRLGYLRGRSGKPRITSHKDLRQLNVVT